MAAPSPDPRAPSKSETTSNPNLKGVNQIALASEKPAELVAFYRDILGLSVLMETNGMTFLSAGAVRLLIGGTYGKASQPGDGVIYFEPEDFAAAEAALTAKNIVFLHPAQPLQREPGRELALRPFHDPEGRALALLGWRPRA